MLKAVNITGTKVRHPLGYVIKKGFAIHAVDGLYASDNHGKPMTFQRKKYAQMVIEQWRDLPDPPDISFVEFDEYKA